jgi:hypothetical protein
MGDVGSLALGGALGTVAVVTKQEFLLAVAGGIFVLEAVSVILQVASFQWTGRRIFAMAPIHHHYELRGWAEPKIIVRFWIISIILAMVALSSWAQVAPCPRSSPRVLVLGIGVTGRDEVPRARGRPRSSRTTAEADRGGHRSRRPIAEGSDGGRRWDDPRASTSCPARAWLPAEPCAALDTGTGLGGDRVPPPGSVIAVTDQRIHATALIGRACAAGKRAFVGEPRRRSSLRVSPERRPPWRCRASSSSTWTHSAPGSPCS